MMTKSLFAAVSLGSMAVLAQAPATDLGPPCGAEREFHTGCLARMAAPAARSAARDAGSQPGAPQRYQTAEPLVGYTDTPILPGTPFRVHDPARPHPAVVTPGNQIGAPPSDAIVLFDGRDLSRWTPAKQAWKVENGYVEVIPNSGDMRTKDTFGDAQLHVEWAAPADVRGTSQNRGNSGIFLQGRYEVQVLDSFNNPTYADGQAGAVYGQWPPLVNPVRKPGEWQSYDIVFEAPRLDGDRLVTPAYLTVFLNGVLLHHRREVMGPTVHRELAKYAAQPAEDALVLQDHQQPVRYRNIWIRRLRAYDMGAPR